MKDLLGPHISPEARRIAVKYSFSPGEVQMVLDDFAGDVAKTESVCRHALASGHSTTATSKWIRSMTIDEQVARFHQEFEELRGSVTGSRVGRVVWRSLWWAAMKWERLRAIGRRR